MENKRIPFKYFLPGIAWFFIVAILTLMPGKDVPQVGWLDRITGFDKVVHAALFGGLVLLFTLPLMKMHLSFQQKIHFLIRLSLATIVWGITVEFLQKFFIPGRDFDLLDWAADALGVFIALWLCVKILKRFEKKNFQ
jgi:VanZ family protein